MRSRRRPAGLMHRFRLPNTEKPSLVEPMPIADGCRSSWKICVGPCRVGFCIHYCEASQQAFSQNTLCHGHWQRKYIHCANAVGLHTCRAANDAASTIRKPLMDTCNEISDTSLYMQQKEAAEWPCLAHGVGPSVQQQARQLRTSELWPWAISDEAP